MKRLPQTLTAAALTGALAFGGAAVAQAQMPLPASIETNGITYDKQPDGSYAPRNRFMCFSFGKYGKEQRNVFRGQIPVVTEFAVVA